MRGFSRQFVVLACLNAALLAQSSVQLIDPKAPPKASTSLLPPAFSGWQKGKTTASRDAAQADAANAAILKEYGFTDEEQAQYGREGRTITVKAARFADAGGAYGAFTFYKSPGMLPQKIGDQGVSASELVLFYRGNILVRATLDRLTVMSAAELRELAAALPAPSGTAANLPLVPTYLPKQAYVRNSAKYVAGPLAAAQSGLSVPLPLLRLDTGAEAALGEYTTDRGTAQLVIVAYPTPQIAGERARAIEAAMHDPNASGAAEVRAVRRSGPLLAIATGAISEADARSLLAGVNYDANVTWSEPTGLEKRNNVGNLIVAAMALSGIILLAALGAGVAFGGVRLLAKRLMPGRVFDRSADVEIIRLKLTE